MSLSKVAFLAILAIPLTMPQDTASPLSALQDELQELRDSNTRLRHELADTRLAADANQRELEELRQFISDHREFGDDFTQYQTVLAIAQREAKRRQTEANRERREQEREARRQRSEDQRRARTKAQAEDDRLDRYRSAGFSHLGLDVFGGRMAFAYQSTQSSNPLQVDYDPFVGLYYRPGLSRNEIDFGSMTISGSVLNAATETRNIGVAVTFFDENGNQVGGEIVQINNARPDVPYPFTATINMALTRPFSSSSTYVLYADPIQ